MMIGLFIVFSSGNLIKRMIGLAIFQTSTALFYISLGKVAGGTAAITAGRGQAPRGARSRRRSILPTWRSIGVDGVVYSNPLPHVLILTAIVVGVATLAVGLAIAVRIREAYGTVEADEIDAVARVDAAQPAERERRDPCSRTSMSPPPALTAQAPILVIAGAAGRAHVQRRSRPGARTGWMISVVTALFALWMARGGCGRSRAARAWSTM